MELLIFKAHTLSNEELISLSKDLINDVRDPIVIKTIKILQRRDGRDVCELIAEVAISGSNRAAYVAIMALGSIESSHSIAALSAILPKLPKGERLTLTKKQIQHQYRLSKISPTKRSLEKIAKQ